MKPTQEQVIAWAREICGPEMPEWRDGTEMEWHEFHALALRCYEAGRKDENEACAKILSEEAIRSISGKSRTNEFDRFKAKLAREMESKIRARIEQ